MKRHQCSGPFGEKVCHYRRKRAVYSGVRPCSRSGIRDEYYCVTGTVMGISYAVVQSIINSIWLCNKTILYTILRVEVDEGKLTWDWTVRRFLGRSRSSADEPVEFSVFRSVVETRRPWNTRWPTTRPRITSSAEENAEIVHVKSVCIQR